jgi:anti-sigma regulatory factor (Ser/Thr protein kinase)
VPIDTNTRLANGDHVVQFYDGDDDLVGIVGGYLAGSVLDGDAIVVVATHAHREALQAALVAAGIDVEAAEDSGQLRVLDAAETLGLFMVDGLPDPHSFFEIIGGLVAVAGLSGRPVRVYGEMVAALWDSGNIAGAIELETLWNGLAAQVPFSLFCAYPVHLMLGADVADAFEQVCHLHSDLVVIAPTPAGAEVSRRFACTLHAPRLARRFISETLHGWGLGDLVDDAMLVVSELATNAVVHGGSDFTVGLSRGDDRVRVSVADTSNDAPQPRNSELTTMGGRGLRLVDVVSVRWGHEAVHGGKVVWAELADRDVALT